MRSPFQQFLSDILRRWRQKATESEMETALDPWAFQTGTSVPV